ncbi:MAG: hypothetical protein WCT12_13195, partial [Verrucomicrobiota bacterium]
MKSESLPIFLSLIFLSRFPGFTQFASVHQPPQRNKERLKTEKLKTERSKQKYQSHEIRIPPHFSVSNFSV